jgi:hypothetical protein
MERLIEPEILDDLAVGDPLAAGSRRDLRRINWWMGNVRGCRRGIEVVIGRRRPGRLVELGCGDGTFMMELARCGPQEWRGTEVWLVDRAPAVCAETVSAIEAAGWRARVVRADVFEWLREAPEADVYLANLFLHHFENARLETLFRAVAARGAGLVACEPRRSRWGLEASRLVGLIGCNRVTRHDAVVSVRAGFAGNELTELWPRNAGWVLEEGGTGMFSHLFTARPDVRHGGGSSA